MRYAVTGAAGFIGSHLCDELQRRGHEVVGYDCFTDSYDPTLKELNTEGLDVRRVDLAQDSLDFVGFDGVFHLAGQPGVRSLGDAFALFVRRNLLATQRVFEAAARDGVRVAFASSSSIYGDAETYPTPETSTPRPLSPYGVTKLACEHLAHVYRQAFGLDYVLLRYFTVYAHVSGPTWRSRVSSQRSRAERPSSFTATASSRAGSRLSRTPSMPRSAQSRVGPAHTTLAGGPR